MMDFRSNQSLDPLDDRDELNIVQIAIGRVLLEWQLLWQKLRLYA
jgi:hypothetical protein